MRTLLDTHFLLWVLTSSPRLARFPWLDEYRPWGVSPFSLLEMQFLAEVGRLEMQAAQLVKAIAADPRLVLDEVLLLAVVRKALELGWTRDPFDRLLAAHSLARRVPLCTVDRRLSAHHPLLVPELK